MGVLVGSDLVLYEVEVLGHLTAGGGVRNGGMVVCSVLKDLRVEGEYARLYRDLLHHALGRRERTSGPYAAVGHLSVVSVAGP